MDAFMLQPYEDQINVFLLQPMLISRPQADSSFIDDAALIHII